MCSVISGRPAQLLAGDFPRGLGILAFEVLRSGFFSRGTCVPCACCVLDRTWPVGRCLRASCARRGRWPSLTGAPLLCGERRGHGTVLPPLC